MRPPLTTAAALFSHSRLMPCLDCSFARSRAERGAHSTSTRRAVRRRRPLLTLCFKKEKRKKNGPRSHGTTRSPANPVWAVCNNRSTSRRRSLALLARAAKAESRAMQQQTIPNMSRPSIMQSADCTLSLGFVRNNQNNTQRQTVPSRFAVIAASRSNNKTHELMQHHENILEACDAFCMPLTKTAPTSPRNKVKK